MNLEQIKAEMGRLNEERQKVLKEASRLHDLIRELQIERLRLEHGVSVGSIVEMAGARFKVAGFRFWSDEIQSLAWLNGFKATKDGGWSKKQQCLYSDWKVVE